MHWKNWQALSTLQWAGRPPEKKAGGVRWGGTPHRYKNTPLLERPLRSQLVGWWSSSNIVCSSVGWSQEAVPAVSFLSFFDHFCDLVPDIDFRRFLCRLSHQHGPLDDHIFAFQSASKLHGKSILFSMLSLGRLVLSWLDFLCQLEYENLLNPCKNRCQEAFLNRLHFLIDLYSIFVSNFDPPTW